MSADYRPKKQPRRAGRKKGGPERDSSRPGTIFPHGLGDATQLTVVLRHLRKYRPDWEVDVLVGRGKESIYDASLCRRAYHDQEEHPRGPYQRVFPLGFFENYRNYFDRPTYKVTNCLRDELDIADYDPELGRYFCQRRPAAQMTAKKYLASIGCTQGEGGKYNCFVIHFAGNTSPDKKNLAQWQAEAMVRLARRLGRTVIVLDWDGRSTLADGAGTFTPPTGKGDIWGGFGSGDAEVLACLIHYSEAFIGIDSGPGKVAATTDTPSLVCWRGHHPIQFEGPSPNTVHLVPKNHHSLPPCCEQPLCAVYFEKNYRHRFYEGENGLVEAACKWLAEALGEPGMDVKELVPVSYALPNGIGDTTWALLKARSVSKGQDLDITLAGDPRREVDHRSEPFLKRFNFVKSVRVSDVPMLEDKEHPTDALGRYRYLPDGPRGAYHYLVPNKALEEGKRIEEWLPDHPCDWDIFDHFSWEKTEAGKLIADGLGPFVAFYLGPEAGHTDEGHNRGWLWEPRHWADLGRAFKEEHGLAVAVVGADYDRPFWERYVKPGVEKDGMYWADLIGKLEIGETLRLLREAKFLISYQCGLGVVLHYLGGKVAMWWRPSGDSAHPKHLVSFDERMATAWLRPGWEENYLGLIYKRETVGDLLGLIEERGWLS